MSTFATCGASAFKGTEGRYAMPRKWEQRMLKMSNFHFSGEDEFFLSLTPNTPHGRE